MLLPTLTLLHSERPKLHTILAFLSAIELNKVLSFLLTYVSKAGFRYLNQDSAVKYAAPIVMEIQY